MFRIARRVVALVVFAGLTACGGSDDGGGGPTAPTATSIVLTPASTAAFASFGETRTITALVRDASQSALANPSVTFTSSNASVATVTGSGTSATVTSAVMAPYRSRPPAAR